MIILIRSNNILSDPRAMKYIKYLCERGKDYKLIGWDRDGNTPDQPNTFYFRDKTEFNVGGLKAAFNRIKWMWFVYKTLQKINHKNIALHCCDLDAAYPATIYKLTNRSISIIFDVFDWFSDTLYNQGTFIVAAMKRMERISVRMSDYIIICEPEREKQIPYIIPSKKLKVLPNIPYFDNSSFLCKKERYRFNNNLLTFSYVGGFSEDRCIETIISLAKEGYINLAIAGFGNKKIEDILFNLKGNPNIKYYGKVHYLEGLQIMYNSDIVYAMYSTTNPNHIYAAPNKFYESMFVGHPIFTTKGIILEKKVTETGVGYVSGESKDDILQVIESMDSISLKEKAEKAKLYWGKYKDFTATFMRTEYESMIR